MKIHVILHVIPKPTVQQTRGRYVTARLKVALSRKQLGCRSCPLDARQPASKRVRPRRFQDRLADCKVAHEQSRAGLAQVEGASLRLCSGPRMEVESAQIESLMLNIMFLYIEELLETSIVCISNVTTMSGCDLPDRSIQWLMEWSCRPDMLVTYLFIIRLTF